MYAEEVNYWKTSRTSPDVWLEKAKREIIRAGGEILGDAFGSEQGGRGMHRVRLGLMAEVTNLHDVNRLQAHINELQMEVYELKEANE